MSTEREKALEDALAQIDRIFGKNSTINLNSKKVDNKVARTASEEIVVDWSLRQLNNQPWEGLVTIGYKWEKSHDHVTISVKDLSKVIAQLKLLQRVAKLEAALKNIKDFPPVFAAEK